MTVGPEYPSSCVSYIATPIPAFATITPEPIYSDQILTPVYEYTPVSRSPTSSIIMVTSGLAVADPVIVAWQAEELQSFPDDYRTSLAQRIGVSLPSSTLSSTPSSRSASAPPSSGLSTSAKAGIGVGAVLIAAIIGIILMILRIRKRRKYASTTQVSGVAEMEDQDQNNTQRKWFFGGKWRMEAHAEGVHEIPAEPVQRELDSRIVQNELDSRHVHIVPGPPAELDGSVPQSNAGHHATDRTKDHGGD
jgi:hypothetical protein